ncbi:MAG TPA: putative metal-dependent hydrolase [Gemmatimonadaceae bacterium]
MTDPRYPIGPFSFDIMPTPQDRARHIDAIAALPSELRAVLANVTPGDLERTYRPGGWTVRQLVHHLPDSHLNGYVRHKLLLTEDQPTIKPYDEARWAELPDSKDTPITVSLDLLEALHQRWTVLLRSLRPDDFAKCYFHPEVGRAVPLDVSLANYAWHGKHHTAHIRLALGREG